MLKQKILKDTIMNLVLCINFAVMFVFGGITSDKSESNYSDNTKLQGTREMTPEETEELKEKLRDSLKKAFEGSSLADKLKIDTEVVKDNKVNKKKKGVESKKIQDKSFLKLKSKSKEVQDLIKQYNLLLMERKLKLIKNQGDSESINKEIKELLKKKNKHQKELDIINLKNKVSEEKLNTGRIEMVEKKETISQFKKKKKIKNYIFEDKKYTYNPYDSKTKTLSVSDRVVNLPKAIMFGTGSSVVNKINFYANQNDYPIFLMIDTCYGGSWNDGMLILKAVERSKIPVYVVLKTLAASMAAILVTRAKQSFAYPNAAILHHQVSALGVGNVYQTEAFLKFLKETSDLAYAPIVKKMGLDSVDEFHELMYKNDLYGDWIEFADRASSKYNWVNNIINNIKQTHIQYVRPRGLFDDVKIITNRRDKILLPSLKNGNFYFIYNPNGMFQFQK